MKNIIFISFISIVTALLTGCPSTKEAAKTETVPAPTPSKKPAVPDITFSIGSVNLAKLTKRVESNDIEQFVSILKKRKIDLLTLQDVNRYPNVSSRIDIIDEISKQAEMRNVFGETITISGRQNGNAVFSTYPIRSNDNSHYDLLRSRTFEAALQAVVDCGARDVVIVSTWLPEKATIDDITVCANKLDSLSTLYINRSLIITGNLSKVDALRTLEQYDTIKPSKEDDAPRIWFSHDGSLKLLNQKVENTALGHMTVIEFGLFRQPQP